MSWQLVEIKKYIYLVLFQVIIIVHGFHLSFSKLAQMWFVDNQMCCQ